MRVSVTDLDAYRRWREDEEAELEPLLRQLRKLEPPTEPMLAGSALHKALEHAEPGVVSTLEIDGYKFIFDLNAELALPDIREIKAEKVYMIDGLPVTVVGKIDTLDARTVEDHKATSRFDAERFLDTYQWRYYLDIFGATRFRWNVFEMAEIGERAYKVFALHRLEQFRYGAMHADCVRLLRDFVEFARVQLPERLAAAA